jgi:hypothetical protein
VIAAGGLATNVTVFIVASMLVSPIMGPVSQPMCASVVSVLYKVLCIGIYVHSSADPSFTLTIDCTVHTSHTQNRSLV